jgi:hypothetical protein
LIGNTFGTGIGGGGVWEFGRIVVVSVHEGWIFSFPSIF